MWSDLAGEEQAEFLGEGGIVVLRIRLVLAGAGERGEQHGRQGWHLADFQTCFGTLARGFDLLHAGHDITVDLEIPPERCQLRWSGMTCRTGHPGLPGITWYRLCIAWQECHTEERTHTKHPEPVA